MVQKKLHFGLGAAVFFLLFALTVWIILSIAPGGELNQNLNQRIKNVRVLFPHHYPQTDSLGVTSLPPLWANQVPWQTGGPDMNLGYNRQPVWIGMDVEPGHYILRLAYPLLDRLDVYTQGPEGVVHQSTGRNVPLEHRSIILRDFAMPVDTGPAGQIYLRLTGQDSLAAPVVLYTPQEFEVAENSLLFADSILLGVYYGIIFVTILYNLLLYLSVRDSNYLYIVCFILILHGIFQLSVNGLLVGLFTGPVVSNWWARDIIGVSLGLGLFFALLCCVSFLRTARYAPQLDKFIRWVCMPVSLILTGAVFILPYYYVIQAEAVFGMASIVVILVAGIYALRAGHAAARFYLMGWMVMGAGAVLYALKIWNFVPVHWLTDYGLQAGMAAEAVLLSLALGDYYNQVESEKSVAQAQAYKKERLAGQWKADLLDYLRQAEQYREQILTLEGSQSLEHVLEKVLHSIRDILHPKQSFIIVAYKGRRYLQSWTDLAPELEEGMRSHPVFDQIEHTPGAIHRYFDRIRLVPEFARALDRVSRTTRGGRGFHRLVGDLRALHRSGFEATVPIAHQKQVFGYLVIGAKEDGRPFSTREIQLLDTFRYSVALAIRNALLYNEILEMKGQAESRANRLSDYLSGMGEAIRHKISDKTIVYASDAMRSVYDNAFRYAAQNQPVLIAGPTGTGKELMAGAIHDRSEYKGGPFIPINCSAVPAGLWESEIFGYEKGAFTDARKTHSGKIEQAKGGTLFFDEIGEMPLDIQPKLLRLLQERKYQRLGGTKLLQADCRFVFATNRDLDELQKQGTFRPDLYYRISVLTLQLPGLVDRPADIPFLVNHFLERYGSELKSQVKEISNEAMQLLCAHPWPGNIRELENTIIRSVIHARGNVLEPADLPAAFQNQAASPFSGSGPLTTARNSAGAGYASNPVMVNFSSNKGYDEMMRDYSRHIVHQALDSAGGDKQKAAKLLKVKRATFYYRLKELGIK